MPSLSILLSKCHSSDPPTAVVSALLPSTDGPSTSTDSHAISSAHASRDDGPPPSKTTRPTPRAVKAAKRSATTMEAEQIPMSKKQAKRLRTVLASRSIENEEKLHSSQKSSPFADMTNSLLVLCTPKSASVKSPTNEVPDFSSDQERSSDSDFVPDADHMSEDDAVTEGLSGFDAGDLVVDNTPSYTGELLSFWCGTKIDSAQITVFDYRPPSIPCCEAVPKLKLFHELSDAELGEFKKPDKIKGGCYFCPAKHGAKGKENATGTSVLQHHYSNMIFECTWPGCPVRHSSFDRLLAHYGSDHDPSLSPLKCDKCNFAAKKLDILTRHKQLPHPRTRSDALKSRSVVMGSHPRREATWKDPTFCTICGIYYAEWYWKTHVNQHKEENRTFDSALPVRGVQIAGLRAGDKCPVDGCPEPYRDFVGWYLHCTKKHPEYFMAHGGYIPSMLGSEARARMPTFRCTTCFACIPIGQTQRHLELCPARMLSETLGPLMRQRAAAYNVEPGLLQLERGVHRMGRRCLMGVLQEATNGSIDPQWIESKLRAIRNAPFLRSFVGRNQKAPKESALYIVAKIRRGTTPGLSALVQDLSIYVGSTTEVSARAVEHVKRSLSNWGEMGLTLAADEDLYLFRMSISIDERTSVASFNEPDLRRLEQLIIDALGMGTLYNSERVLAPATTLNDLTYRNHLAPRLNQLALVLFESTHTRLIKNGIIVDKENVWKLPVVRRELQNLIKNAPNDAQVAGMGSAEKAYVHATEQTTRADQACSPIPAPRIFSPEVYDGFAQLQATRGYTDEQMLERIRAWRARNDTLRHTRCPESNESRVPASEIDQSDLHWQLSPGSPDLFIGSSEFGHVEESAYASTDHFDFDDVPTTSNGLDDHAKHSKWQDSEEPHIPAGEIVQSELLRRRSTTATNSFNSPKGSEVSALKTVPNTDAFGSVPLLVFGNCTMRIPSYGGRSSQYVDLARAPMDLTQDSPEASLDERSQKLSVESSESSDEEPPREILDDSSESSLDEPSPTDSGVDLYFDFENVPDTGRKPVTANAENSVEEPIPKESAKNAGAALPSGDVEDEEVDADTNDKCARKNCRRPQSDDINWVQCDDCDKWYHSVCILGEEVEFEEAEFHCECTQNDKRKPRRTQRSKK